MSQARAHHNRNKRGRHRLGEPSSTDTRSMACVDNRPLVLPAFVAARRDPGPGEFLRDFWCTDESGDWSRDVVTGRIHARDAIRFIQVERTPHVLNWIVADMMRKRRFGPLEIGFFQELGAVVLRVET